MGDVIPMLKSPIARGIGQTMMQDAKFFMDYARWREDTQAFESWEQAVKRVMDMHRKKYADRMTPELEELIQFAEDTYLDQRVLAAQRTLQFGGEQIFKHEAKVYNCASTYADRTVFFGQALYLLLCGVGAGFSVQTHHVAKLPEIRPRTSDSKLHVIEDSIEGWKNAVHALVSSFFTGDVPAPEYQGYHVNFDYSQIRPKGALISGGFKAPGPDGLRQSLTRVEEVFQKAAQEGSRLRPIQVYDIVMHLADAVLSGGVRRSATICLFSKDDEEMMNAKTGNWLNDNPQRGRSNNSAVLVRDELTYDEFMRFKESTREYGEPGFILSDSTEFTYNPLNVAA